MTNGIVLKRHDYEESSIIMSILNDKGIESVMARYVKKGNKMYLPLTEPLTEISYIATKSRELSYLKSGELINPYKKTKAELNRICLSNVVLEYSYLLIDAITDKKSYYDLVLVTLSSIEDSVDPEDSLFRYLILLTKVLGISLRKDYIIETYGLSTECMDAINAIFSGNKPEKRKELRLFLRAYFDKEMGVKPRSFDFYLNIYNE